jgi:hypothetical protein
MHVHRIPALAVRLAVVSVPIAACAPVAWGNSGTQIPLSQYQTNAQQVTPVANGNFSTVANDTGANGFAEAPPWIRLGNVYANAPVNPPPDPSLTSPYAGQAHNYTTAADHPMYVQIMDRPAIQPGKDYVLSGFLWNFGRTGKELTQLKLEDSNSILRNYALTIDRVAKDNGDAATGYFVYGVINEKVFSDGDPKNQYEKTPWTGDIYLEVYTDKGDPPDSTPEGFPEIIGQFDNVGWTLATDFRKATWQGASGGSFSAAGSWNGTVPNRALATAVFGAPAAAAANTVVNVDQPVSLSTVTFGSAATRYNLSGPNRITINGNGTDAEAHGHGEIRVTAGQHEISAPVDFATTADVNIADNAALKLSGKVTGKVYSISLGNGSTLDITRNTMVVDYWGANPFAALRAKVLAAYDNGKWDLAGLTSSTAADPAFVGAVAVAIVDNAVLGAPALGDLPLDPTTVLVMTTWVGDANLDGIVDGKDLARMSSTGTDWSNGDFNYDGVVNADDYMLFNVGAARGGSQPVAAVPEPGVGGVVLGLAVVARRWRRKL